MTSKERIICALKGGVPDMVPVCPGMSEMYPIRFSGLSYMDIHYHQKMLLWKARLDVIKRFNVDGFVHGSFTSGTGAPPSTRELLLDEPEKKIVRTTIHTKKGDLAGETVFFHNDPYSIQKGIVDNPEKDYEKVLELLADPATMDDTTYKSIYSEAGDGSMVGYWVESPIEWWSMLRRSPEIMIMDLYDYPETMRKIFDAFTEWALALVEEAEKRVTVDCWAIGGSILSLSVISPTIFTEWALDYIQKMVNKVHDCGNIVQLHVCGKSRELLDILATTDIDAVEPLERRPTGNCDLAEVKKKFGKIFSLKGNVNSIETMLHGSPADVEREVKQCIKDAAEGGGYILSVGDQVPYGTPEENMRAFVEAGRRYGAY